MPISLKHINTSDSDNIKLGKVNYNFDQLVANGGGPRGPQGPIGQNGPQGTTGQQGFQGPIGNTGFQGTEGPISVSYWNKIAANPLFIDADTLVPIHYTNDQFAPIVNIGYIENDPEYGTKDDLVGGKTPYQWKIHRKQYSPTNLRFLNYDIPSNGFDFKLEKLGAKDVMTMGFIEPEDSISTYNSSGTSFRGSISSTDSLLINATGIYFKTSTIFNSPASIKNALIIENANAGTDKIAISADNTGKVIFKSVQELGGTVPFGTIVSILPSIFADNTKFKNTESIAQSDTSPVHISVGKGVGNYEGWYLCNGQKWTNGNIPNPANGYVVPMLGNFNYTIDDNPHSTSPLGQGAASTSNFRTHITGGSDIDMTATSVPTLVYNVTSTVETSTVQVDPGTGTTFKIKQLPQIIYLGSTDLYWFDQGSGQAPAIPLTFLLDDANTTATKLNPDPYTINTITDRSAGNSYTFTSTITAPTGYYWSTIPTTGDITGLPGYATITGITAGPGTYPITISIDFSISSHPSSLSTVTLGINTTSLITAATVPITLIRHDNSYGSSPIQYYTCSTPSTTVIQYNFNTGYYDYQLVYTAQPGYAFSTSQFVGIFGATTYDGGFAWSPPVGGGWINVKNNWTDYSLSNNNTTLTVNLRLDQIPLTGYLTTQGYEINIITNPTAPRITSRSQPTNEITQSNGTGLFTNNLAIENFTGGPVYLWIAIYQGSGTQNSAVSAQATFTYIDPFFGWPNTGLISVAAPATPNYVEYYNSSPYLLNTSGSVTSAFTRNSTSDSSHIVRLFWSTSPLSTSSKTQLIYTT